MEAAEKPLVWLEGEVKTPPFSAEARLEAGGLLRRLQRGEKLSMPASRPMPNIRTGCHELRIIDERQPGESCTTSTTTRSWSWKSSRNGRPRHPLESWRTASADF